MTDEKTAADDVIVEIVEFEQKGRAGVDGFKPGFAARIRLITTLSPHLRAFLAHSCQKLIRRGEVVISSDTNCYR